MAPELILHVLPPSHPARTAEAALRLKGLEFEKVTLQADGTHGDEIERIYGEGRRTVPGLLVDGEPVHGSVAILERIELIEPEPPLYPEAIAEAVHAAERWGDEELQDLGRRLPWGAMQFRPEAMGTFAPGGSELDPAGTDFAMRYVRASWKYHRISCERLAADLAGLPEKIAHIESLADEGVIGGDPNAADLQIGSTVRVLLTIGDLEPLLGGTAAERIALEHFPEYPGHVPAGAFPAAWVPATA